MGNVSCLTSAFMNASSEGLTLFKFSHFSIWNSIGNAVTSNEIIFYLCLTLKCYNSYFVR